MVSTPANRIPGLDKEVEARAFDIEFQASENALRVLRARYLEKNEGGACVETPDDLFDRVADTLAEVERTYGANDAGRAEWKKRFKRLMTSRRFMPNSPTLMNAGRSMGMLSACFVLPVPDSIDGIFDSIKHTALIQKAGGGTGFAFDALRPTGDYIKSSGGTTSGPISFWRAFSEATNAIQQGAFRRGANMGMMYIHHPDILKFLHAKQDLSQFTNYNISVKVTDEWMDSFLKNPSAPHRTRNPRNGAEFYLPRNLKIWEYQIRDLIPVAAYDGKTPVYTSQDLWDIIVRHAWQTGEPGVVFMDRINDANPTPHVGRIEATNPCGEQPLLPYEACNLGSINLGVFVKHPCTPQAAVDWDALRVCIHESVRFLDNVIDANKYPLDEITDVCKANRKIGLGLMGFADALYQLNVRYNSEDGVVWGERFMKFLNDEAHDYSEKLAIDRGSFPNWSNSHWDTKYHRPMRNACSTTVAPTGTISIIADCSGGIEPMFSLAFFRNVLKGQDEGKAPMIETHKTFERVARERGFYSEGLMDQIAREGTLAHISSIPADVARVYVCAHDIEPEWHVRMQAAFQRHCDSSISKTINFPHEASAADVEKIYRMAYELQCKGVTVYRDGCRAGQPMALSDSDQKHRQSAGGKPEARAESIVGVGGELPIESPAPPAAVKSDRPEVKTETNLFGERITKVRRTQEALEPRELPAIACAIRVRQQTPFGNMHIQITVDPLEEREVEVFAQLGKGGDLATSDLEAICRMISLWLRAGGRLNLVIKQLAGIGSSLQIPTKHGRIMSLGDGLAQGLRRYMRAKERHGLRALLLGEIAPEDIEREPVHDAGDKAGHRGGNGGSHNGGPVGASGGSSASGGSNGKRAEELDTSVIATQRLVETKTIDRGALPDRMMMSERSTSARTTYRLKCPECEGDLDNGEGCIKCHGCGYAQC